MLKDLMHAIFKEDVEDELDENGEETIHEEIEETQAPLQEETPILHTPPIVEQPIVENIENVHETYVNKEEAKEEAPASPGLFEGLDVDSIASKPKSSKNPYHFDRSKLGRKRKQVDEMEYQAVISPIFGNMEDSQKQFDKVHDAIQLPKPENDTDLVEIISPMYGNNIPAPKPVESIPSYQEVKKKSEKPKMNLDDMLAPAKQETTELELDESVSAKKKAKR